MITTVKYPSSIEKGTQYVRTAAQKIPTSETDAITFTALDVSASSVAEIGGNTQATLFINHTIGSLTKTQFRFYGSYVANPAATDWYQEVVETDATGVATLDLFIIELTGTAKIAYHFPIGAYKAFKITIQGVGTNTNSAITLDCGLKTN